MGYPFDKTWESRINSTASVREIIKYLPHAMITDFTIYRSNKPYEGCTFDDVNISAQKITWENNIKGFFTKRDIGCMLWKFNLGEKQSVQDNAGEIYEVVKDGAMPLNEARWNGTQVDMFKKWMCSGFP